MRHVLALAAVLIVAVPACGATAGELPSIGNVYIQAYGGLRVPDNLTYNGSAQDLGIGTTLGASLGADTSIPGLSVDLDYLHSSTTYSVLGTALTSQSLMLDAQYTLDLNLGINPYLGVGAGGVNLTYKSADSGNALGYQFKLGATGPITDQLSWFGEYRYQQAVGSTINVGSPAYPVEYASHHLLGGIKLSFGGAPTSSGYTGGASY